MASSSIPGVFPPLHFDGHIFMDGGTQWDVNYYSAIEQCVYELGYDMTTYTKEVLEMISVDIAMCGFDTPKKQDVEGNNAIENYIAALNLKKYWFSLDNIDKQLRAYDGVKINYFIQNTDHCGVSSMNFNGLATWCFQEAGMTDAQNALDMGQDAIKHAMNAYITNKQLRKEYSDLGSYVYSQDAALAFAQKLAEDQ